MVLGCSLGTVASGCLGQRGTLGSHGWRSSGSPFAWRPWRAAANANSQSLEADPSGPMAKRLLAEGKPELLPWRSRLKGYRLGARLARGRDPEHDGHLDQTIAYASVDEGSDQPRPLIAAPGDSSEDARPTPSLDNGELQLPEGIGLFPERSRADSAAH